MTIGKSIATSPPRRWFQFRLRTFLVVLLLLCCTLGWIIRERSQLVTWRLKLKELGGPGGGYSHSQPGWHQLLFGPDPAYYMPAFYLNDPEQFGDESLVHLYGLKNLEGLSLSDTKVTDVGLLTLQLFPKLESLELKHTHITDVGLANLKDCKRLYFLDITGTKVTKTGRLNFHKDHPNSRIFPIPNE